MRLADGAGGHPHPYVRKKIVEALFRVGSEQALAAVETALEDVDPDVREEAERYHSREPTKQEERLCPYPSGTGMCEPPGVADLHECSWETQGQGHYEDCFVYKMHTHPGGAADFLTNL